MASHDIGHLAPPSPQAKRGALNLDFTTYGSTGLNAVSGWVREEFIPELTGWEAIRTYKQMGNYDPVCSGILYYMDKMVRRIGWRAEAASSRPQDRQAADYLESCMGDMAMTWIDTISEMMTMAQYGFSLHEIVYKRRCGAAPQKAFRSKFADGRIGWRYLPIRSQDTIYRWDIDACGDILGAEQHAPPQFRTVYLPMQRCLLFRTSTHKNDPSGLSIFRGAYTSWYAKQNIVRFESIGIERNLTGVPMASVPVEILLATGGPAKQTRDSIERMVTQLRADEQAGIIFPLERDSTSGQPLFDFKLLGSPGPSGIDTDKVIQRHDHRIATSVLADFLLMGQSSSSTGSLAMHQDKSGIFGQAIGAFLDIIAETLQPAVAKLFAMNDFPITDNPRLVHDSIDAVDLEQMSKFLLTMSQAGMPLFPNVELEKRIYELAKLPAPLEYEADVDTSHDPDRIQEPMGLTQGDNVTEVHDAHGLATDDAPATDGAPVQHSGVDAAAAARAQQAPSNSPLSPVIQAALRGRR